MNGKNTCIFSLGALQSQNCFLLFLLDSHKTYCVHFQTVEPNEILQ